MHGALYHYYDACDTPANEDRDSAEWHVVKMLEQEGLVRFADPCVSECHDGGGLGTRSPFTSPHIPPHPPYPLHLSRQAEKVNK